MCCIMVNSLFFISCQYYATYGISDSYTGSAGETLPEAVSDTNVPGPPEDNTDPIEEQYGE